ncbi:hypothetical protein MBORA_16150 [Methanobrevibacter oralis]|uniref:Uncharacterized protein n=1 Tax=Methanobrevibacter oralis TaxID=66851 RepID=A0A162FKG9_METOA|nr:hypothetical protein [Methanobrevibacter oralis]KZX11370.1 hypothetical protein MBORA_16150 [Methanobrevibacter oralis]
MHVLEKSFLDLLRGNISIVPDADVYIGNRFSPDDKTPAVIIDLVDETFIRKHYITLEGVQYLRKLYDVDIWINIYANNEEDRQSIIEDVTNRILQAETNHYTTCANYNKTSCSETGNTCEALTSTSGRANKKQCPDLNIYKSFFKQNHIQKQTFKIIGVTNLDDLNVTGPVLRTIFKLNMEYYSYYPIGGRTFNSISIDGDLI